MDKIDRLNEIPVLEYSRTGGFLEYVLVANTDENKRILRELGMTKEDEEYMVCDNEHIDVASFGLDVLGANAYSNTCGFSKYKTM